MHVQSHARNIWYMQERWSFNQVLYQYMQIMVHLPPTNLYLPPTYLAVARNSPPTPAQTEIGKYEFVCTYPHNSLFPTPIYN